MAFNRKKAWRVLLIYVGLVFGGLYFTPFMSDFLIAKGELGDLISWVYWTAGVFLVGILYFKFRINQIEAYGMVVGLIILFLAAFERLEVSTDRFHFLEHGLIFVFVYMALQFSNRGVILFGRALLLCLLIAFADESIQGILPNREAEWKDIWTNLFSYYLAAGLVAIVHQYRRDRVQTSG